MIWYKTPCTAFFLYTEKTTQIVNSVIYFQLKTRIKNNNRSWRRCHDYWGDRRCWDKCGQINHQHFQATDWTHYRRKGNLSSSPESLKCIEYQHEFLSAYVQCWFHLSPSFLRAVIFRRYASLTSSIIISNDGYHYLEVWRCYFNRIKQNLSAFGNTWSASVHYKLILQY